MLKRSPLPVSTEDRVSPQAWCTVTDGDFRLQQVQNRHQLSQRPPNQSVFSFRVKTVISSGLEETHRHVHASSEHQQQTRALKLLPSLRNTDYVFDYFLFPSCCFACSNLFAAMFFINLDSNVGGLFQILFTLLSVLLLSFRLHVYRREQHFKWLWWIYLWVCSSASISYKVTYNACSCQIWSFPVHQHGDY